jgi:hypothetical protein
MRVYMIQTMAAKFDFPFIDCESRTRRGPHVGRYGDMPIPTSQRRKFKKSHRRNRK